MFDITANRSMTDNVDPRLELILNEQLDLNDRILGISSHQHTYRPYPTNPSEIQHFFVGQEHIISELQEGVEVFKYIADDLEFNTDKSQDYPNYLSGLRVAMNSLYTDFKNQFAKVSECNYFKISLHYDQYFVQKVQLGKNILMIVVCEVNNKLGQPVLNLGQIDIMVDEYKRNF